MTSTNQNQKVKQRAFLIFKALFLTLLLLGLGTIYLIFLHPNPVTDNASPVEIKIKSGTEFPKISGQLFEKGLIKHRPVFELAARSTRSVNKIRAGKYQISPGLSNWKLLQQLTTGRVKQERITIPEGKTHRYIASLLQEIIEVDSVNFVALVHDSAFARELGIAAPTLEGYLFPDTYFFTWGLSARQCVQAMLKQFHLNFPDSILDTDPRLGLSRHELVILASLIEGEAQVDSERPIISAIYRNRLAQDMLLQSCPTVQFLLPGGPRRLLNADLEIESPYNTYIYLGLPPGPINNPGKSSLLAAAEPADVPYLFMVARGDGGHRFSTTLSGHIAGKREFDKIRREVAREKRIKSSRIK
jgi:UPF0755 protein